MKKLKVNLISCGSVTYVLDIKLIRTYTTFDLSQKAKKCTCLPAPGRIHEEVHNNYQYIFNEIEIFENTIKIRSIIKSFQNQ
ncbi:hypothetical protein ACOSQ4_013959 [Xanthoceras sorbifolium]